MDNFYIKNISIENFRGYNGKKIYKFEDNSGNPSNVILLSGPNGYGKTTLMDSVEWCLTGNIRRVIEEYKIRCSQKSDRTVENSSKGLIYNINSKYKFVCVKINALYRNKEVILTRQFDGENELDAFEQESLPIILCDDDIKDEINCLMSDIKDTFNFNNICSYDKNIDMYKKSRTDIYNFFEETFVEFSKTKKILTNLENVKINLNEEKKDITQKIEVLSKSKEEKEKLLKSINKSECIKIRTYPNKKIFDSEIIIKDTILNATDINIDKDLEAQIEILKDILYKKVNQNLEVIINEKKKQFNILKIKELKSLYVKEKERISYMQRLNDNNLVSDKRELDSFKENINYQIKNKKFDRFIETIISDKSKFNHLIDENTYNRIINNYDTITSNKKIIEVLNKQIDFYSNNSPIIKAMRYIVDNRETYEIYRKENELCPLCGSKLIDNTEMGQIAKEFLGNKDIERQNLVKDVNEYSQKNNIILENIKEILEKLIDSLNREINDILQIKEELKRVYELCEELQISFKELSSDLLVEKFNEFENDLNKIYIENKKDVDILKLIEGLKEPFLFKYTEGLKMYDNNITEENIVLISKLRDEINKNYYNLNYIINQKEYNVASVEQIKERLDITKDIVLYKNNNFINQEIKNINEQISVAKLTLKNIKKKITIVNSFKREINRVKIKYEKDETKKIAEPLSMIYKKITRNTNITQVNLKKATANKKSSLEIVDVEGNSIPFANIMSAGQVSTLSISIYFAKAVLNKRSKFKFYMMDDPIQTMDDLNIISLIDLLRFQFMQPKENRFIDQLFISTCDEDLEKLIMHKMKSFDISIINQNFIG